ncbi:hypothetical protein EOM81_12895 [bacterium]|nr:hypothetical protein [bacterium]
MNEEATKVLTVVCEKMGIGAEMVWGAYMKQAAIWGWASIAVFITLVLFTAVVLSKLIKSLKKGRDKDT